MVKTFQKQKRTKAQKTHVLSVRINESDFNALLKIAGPYGKAATLAKDVLQKFVQKQPLT